ncbi:MAG: glutamate racemase [Patescibacteria group bacterium]
MIGVFDSGIGGLTVIKELERQLPIEQVLYFGDTARTPYGNKSPDTIVRYALQDADFLAQKNADCIIIACNTASAVAADQVADAFPELPVFEVITPAVQAAIAATSSGRIGVIGTRATITSNIYVKKISSADPGLTVIGQACPLFVPLAEEGWLDTPETLMIAKHYLQPVLNQHVDTLILGCTHYPLLKNLIRGIVGPLITLVDPAELVVAALKQYIQKKPGMKKAMTRDEYASEYFFSDTPPHLNQLIKTWLGHAVSVHQHIIA